MGVDSCAQCYKINIFLSLHLYKEPSWAATVDDAVFTQLHHDVELCLVVLPHVGPELAYLLLPGHHHH
jgi:hypothetical protein